MPEWGASARGATQFANQTHKMSARFNSLFDEPTGRENRRLKRRFSYEGTLKVD
jgi:hypothetical protein